MSKIIICLLIFLSTINAYTLAEQWNDVRSTHFIVYYKGDLNDFAVKVIDKAERLYDEIADYLGFTRYNYWLWENRAMIYIYEDAEEYRSATGQPIWSSGCALTKEKTIKTYPRALGFFDTVLPHEMAHIIFREFVGFDNPNVPIWLDEGVAGYQEKAKRYNVERIIRTAITNNKFITLENLHILNPHTINNPELVDIFYAEAISIVHYLIKEFGRDRFVRFCRALRDKKTLNEVLDSAYRFTGIKELDSSWQRYLKNE